MLIGGLQKTTLVDYPGKIAATIFTIGCNYRCSFCHNPEIVKGIAKVIPEESVLDFLKSRKDLLDGVCITGGEPTMQDDLINFIKKIKHLGYSVKLDTNGYRPQILKKLFSKKLLDYVAMDIKAPWKKYSKIVNRTENLDNVKESVLMIRESGVPYEFRSTVLPALHSEKDIVAMARQIKGSDKYFLQQFRPVGTLVDPDFINKVTYTKKQLTEIMQSFKDWFKVCKVR
ncbi:MAG: Anaerobic ribonucleoside-triphosphate reductase activating protein [Parcubacteria group bacterium GW2011_GWC2_38_7]|nr:MAG: Anaerobic ribonucleoside-triphosphate reductase activating protein [Parcubacteria group bacterium GW2011_GWC2_38_7]